MTKCFMEKIYDEFFKHSIIDININTKFWWTSGILSPIYIDNRLIFNYSEFRNTIENKIAEIIKEKFPDTTKIIGVASAGIGHAAIVAHILNIPFAYGRAEAKSHGKKNIIEGKILNTDKVIIIEDLISTGKSVANVVKTVQAMDVKVNGVISIFSYEIPCAQKLFKSLNIDYVYLIGINEIINYGEKVGHISKDEAKNVRKFISTIKNNRV